MLSTVDYFNSWPDRIRDGFAVDDVDLDPAEFVRLAGNRIVPGHDGLVSVVQDGATCSGVMPDFSRRSDDFDVHQDGLYLFEPPRYVLLWCENEGMGQTVTRFYDGESLAAAVSGERFNVDALLMNYVGRDGHSYSHRLVETNPNTGRPVFMMASRGYVSVDHTGKSSVREVSRLMSYVFGKIDSFRVFSRALRNGEAVMFDNWRYLHSRTGTSDPKRKLVRIWLDRC